MGRRATSDQSSRPAPPLPEDKPRYGRMRNDCPRRKLRRNSADWEQSPRHSRSRSPSERRPRTDSDYLIALSTSEEEPHGDTRSPSSSPEPVIRDLDNPDDFLKRKIRPWDESMHGKMCEFYNVEERRKVISHKLRNLERTTISIPTIRIAAQLKALHQGNGSSFGQQSNF